MTDLITDFETFAEYRADRVAKRQQFVTEFLFDALKNAEIWDEIPRTAEGFSEFEASWKAFEVKDDSLKLDSSKPAYIVRTV